MRKSKIKSKKQKKTNQKNRNKIRSRGAVLPKKTRQKPIYKNYYLLKISDINKNKIKIPDNQYDFLILNAKPHNIYLTISTAGKEIGHTSFPHVAKHFKKELKLYKKTGRWDNSKTDTVKYAGELIIKKGKLNEWNNISGHYMPPLKEASDTGLMMDKFKPFFDGEKELKKNSSSGKYEYWDIPKKSNNSDSLSVQFSSRDSISF